MERQPDLWRGLDGAWRLAREVRHAAGGTVRAEGTARFAPEGDGLAEREEGRAVLPGGSGMAFEQRRLWRAEGGRLTLWKGDGTLLCVLDGGEGVHGCPPDLYRVRLDLSGLPSDWSAEWRVTGPRKDYVMATRYVRPGGQDRPTLPLPGR
ncbi:hypothetical protein BCF33_1016 [Hasllibacter halocynthiae]|uniref:DUF6314 domain-containing protein n=1 Tax=Hasllibacter halocynthiae TaxID=595589 RepID=A0A2T0X901_9RHOB|nr:DUF6314 family protein [Hasllibacter halocynthiae]PRY95397.1 hypothetical protein BCF33_1016 [Hasllibacter halocynthiae]